MNGYASITRTKRNVWGLLRRGWGFVATPAHDSFSHVRGVFDHGARVCVVSFDATPHPEARGMTEFTAEEKFECARREARMRREVYPRFIEHGRMTESEANREIAIMESIREDYRKQMRDLFSEQSK